jgi:hypothetical protein
MEQAATISDGGVPPLMIPPVYTEHFMYPPEMMRGMMPSSEAVMTPHGLVTSLWPVSPIPRIGGPGSESSIESAQSMGVSYIPAAVLGTTPPSPPNFPQVHYLPPPWAAQNSGLSHPMSPPYGPVDLPDAFPLPPIQHVNAWSHGKNWREVHGGFVSEDGHVIQHGWQSAKKVPSGRKPHADFNTLILKVRLTWIRREADNPTEPRS